MARKAAAKKQPSPKKPPARKRRANTMLGPNNEASSAPARVDVPATPAAKTPSLRLVMGSRKTATPSLRLHGPKPPVQQHPDPITDSLLELIAPSSPPPSQLPDSLDSMPPPDLPASKRRSITPGAATLSQMLARSITSSVGKPVFSSFTVWFWRKDAGGDGDSV